MADKDVIIVTSNITIIIIYYYALLDEWAQLIDYCGCLSVSFFVSHKLAMKVTASEVFKGKKANYTSSIPKPFMPHRLGEKFLDNAAVCV